jgi:exopolyphosphatase/guanosine-5'-triphosphate,3'-diphosphate pyrophosphatase
MRFAAIDAGSNALRLLFSRVDNQTEKVHFEKVALMRMPLRLGEDVFVNGVISAEKTEKLVETMIAFKHLINVYQPIEFMACATSAMREADNRKAIVSRIEEEAGIRLEVIDGEREARIIYSNHIERILDSRRSYLYIDVGGGSTEMTFFKGKKTIRSRSFNIGTIRIKEGLVSRKRWKEMKKWVEAITAGEKNVCAIGTGGNINTLYGFSGKKSGKPLSYKKLGSITRYISGFPVEDRVIELGMKPDRADVVIPASSVYLSAMKWGGIDSIYVPKLGLADGMIHVMYKKHQMPAKP